ncbi:MAG: hypothetical protein M0C28_16180 [Candidatus Moduliflexus flocculans]|nr:hypothetical protein [Candidatus Moduliflexus flocculans]
MKRPASRGHRQSRLPVRHGGGSGLARPSSRGSRGCSAGTRPTARSKLTAGPGHARIARARGADGWGRHRRGVGRRRHDQRGGVGADAQPGRARHRADGVGQRPGAGDRRSPPAHEAALAAALSGAERTIDAGELNGRVFFNAAGVGFDAHVAAAFRRRRPGTLRGSRVVRVGHGPGAVSVPGRATYVISPEAGRSRTCRALLDFGGEHAAVGQRRAHRPRRAHGRRAPRPGDRAGPPARRRRWRTPGGCSPVRIAGWSRRRDAAGARGDDSLHAAGARARGRRSPPAIWADRPPRDPRGACACGRRAHADPGPPLARSSNGRSPSSCPASCAGG